MQAKKPGWTALPFHLPPVLLEEEEEGHEAGRDPIEALGEALNEAEGSVEGGEETGVVIRLPLLVKEDTIKQN